MILSPEINTLHPHNFVLIVVNCMVSQLKSLAEQGTCMQRA